MKRRLEGFIVNLPALQARESRHDRSEPQSCQGAWYIRTSEEGWTHVGARAVAEGATDGDGAARRPAPGEPGGEDDRTALGRSLPRRRDLSRAGSGADPAVSGREVRRL